jgi:hypothetical protein
VTVQGSTATAREAIDGALDRLAPAADRLTEAAGQVRDHLRDQVAPMVADKVAEAAVQVREQVAPKVADKVAEALSTAADRIGTHGTHGSRSSRLRWKPLAIGAGAVVGAVVVVRVMRARRAASAWEYDASGFSSELPDADAISDRTQATIEETVDEARAAVSEAVAAAADPIGGTKDSKGSKGSKESKDSKDTGGTVTDVSDRVRAANRR